MISLTSAEVNAWIVAFFFPLARILALLVAAPPFNNDSLSTQVRLLLGLVIAIAIAPALPPIPTMDPASGQGLLILTQQMIIGLVVSIFQAATQINESTLSFIPKLVGIFVALVVAGPWMLSVIPKLLATFLVLILAGPWMLQMMVDYIRRLFESIPQMIG